MISIVSYYTKIQAPMVLRLDLRIKHSEEPLGGYPSRANSRTFLSPCPNHFVPSLVLAVRTQLPILHRSWTCVALLSFSSWTIVAEMVESWPISCRFILSRGQRAKCIVSPVFTLYANYARILHLRGETLEQPSA